MVSQILHARTSRPVVGVFTCPTTSLVPPGPTPNFNLPILLISLYLSPGKLSESSLVQTPHLCLQDPLPTSACRDTLNAHLQVGVFTRPNTSLVSPGLTPNFSLSRYIQALHKKTCRLRQSIDKSHFSNDLTANMPKDGSETKTRHLNQEY